MRSLSFSQGNSSGYRKTSVVIGGTSGIGKAVVEDFARMGWDVLFTYYHSQESAFAMKAGIESTSVASEVECMALDVRDKSAVESFFEQFTAKRKRLDNLVYLAGSSQDAYVRNMSPEMWNSAIDVHLTGCFNCLRAAIPIFCSQRSGHIVTMSSDAALLGAPMRANYAAAKAGVIGLTKSAARELAPFGITANTVAPGMINTSRIQAWPADTSDRLRESIPLKRFGEPREVAGLIRFLCSDEAAYITGQVIQIDGGLRM